MRMSEVINRYLIGTEAEKEVLRVALRAMPYGLDVGAAQAFEEWSDINAGDVFVAGRRERDGFVFYGIKYQDRVFVTAGCRNFTLEIAREHWDRSHRQFESTLPLLDAIQRWADGTPQPAAQPIPVIDQELVRHFLGDRLNTLFIHWVVHTVGSQALSHTRGA